ncbi:hypothetical protein L1887_21292 [Cichorium endivia]|nr:hypothetical protein L1887_21292 [Cichorium endivia]
MWNDTVLLVKCIRNIVTSHVFRYDFIHHHVQHLTDTSAQENANLIEKKLSSFATFPGKVGTQALHKQPDIHSLILSGDALRSDRSSAMFSVLILIGIGIEVRN